MTTSPCRGPAATRCDPGRLAAADFEGTETFDADHGRVADLIEHYDDLALGTKDASVVAIAERLGVREIATLDRRHFTAVRPSHLEAFALLPESPRVTPAVRKQFAGSPGQALRIVGLRDGLLRNRGRWKRFSLLTPYTG